MFGAVSLHAGPCATARNATERAHWLADACDTYLLQGYERPPALQMVQHITSVHSQRSSVGAPEGSCTSRE